MDCEKSYLINNNWSRELDTLFCGFFSCCASMLEEDDDQDPSEQSYLTTTPPPYLKLSTLKQPNLLINLGERNKDALSHVFTPTPF